MPNRPQNPSPLVLTSRSPRRRDLLTAAGIAHRAADPGVDDGPLRAGRVTPDQWVAALAYLKARAGAEKLADEAEGHWRIMGADTVCVQGARVLGQPRDRAHAQRMLRSFIGSSHRVVSGVALIDTATGERSLIADSATVTWGHVADADLEAYLDTPDWRGKAGGYNLFERTDAGWPIEVSGDPDTVVGLPMRRLPGMLAGFGTRAQEAGAA